jgi:hypothetical protein
MLEMDNFFHILKEKIKVEDGVLFSLVNLYLELNLKVDF